MPPKPNPTLYSIKKTFVWFAIVSLALTGSLVAIVLTDYKREWKDFQKQFMKIKADKARAELKEAEGKIDQAALAELKKQAGAAEAALGQHRAEMDALDKDLSRLDTDAAKAKTDYQTKKQYQDSYRYYYEEYASHHDKRAEEYKKKLDEITPNVDAAKNKQDSIDRERESKLVQKEAFLEKEKTLRKEMDKLLEERTRAERKLKKVEPSRVKDILNAPMLDFVAPSLKVQQLVLDDLYDDYHFAKTQKVDRCTTCHLGIDQKGFEDAPQPFKTHPNLDLYLGSLSPHPIEKIGCTVCHGGNGHSVSFNDAAHTPKNEEQAKEWAKKYHWHELEKWDHKMKPLNHVQAECAKCHRMTMEVPQADKLNRGRKLAETYGCLNCHKINGFENRWKVGPDLTNLNSKLSKDWVARWVDNPRDFRADTHMPQIFHLSNTSSPEDKARNLAAIHAIAAYLEKNSGAVELAAPPVKGNAANGENLVKTLGCTGCHTVAGVEINNYAPQLTGLGSKVDDKWLYSWLKDPKHYSPETRMPSLRLSDQEAADITAYLLSQKNEEFEKKTLPPADPKVVDSMILDNLQGSMRRSEAEAELGKMSEEDKMLFLGKKSIAHQGCFTCHKIAGFEDAKPIGAELSNEGVKDLHQFDFGFVHDIDHTRQAWLAQKLKDPRSFDGGKVKSYYDKLRMPQFHFTDEERDDLVTFLLSLTQEEMPLKMQKRLDSADRETEKGRYLVAKLHCNGCHTLDGKEGGLRLNAEDLGAAPPTLVDEGKKAQEKWLHGFLHQPTTIRPWLTYRMPTFGFKDEDLDALVRYFAHLNGQEIAYQGHPPVSTSAEKLAAGKLLVEKLQCQKCHQVNAESAAMGASFLAPDFALAKNRLKPEWVQEWISDPQKLEPGTMMPTFFTEGEASPIEDVLGGDMKAQIEAIRDYLYVYETGSSKGSSSQEPSKNSVESAS